MAMSWSVMLDVWTYEVSLMLFLACVHQEVVEMMLCQQLVYSPTIKGHTFSKHMQEYAVLKMLSKFLPVMFKSFFINLNSVCVSKPFNQ